MRPTDWAPLADSDPTPGDTYEISALATHLTGIASTIREQMSRFSGIDAGEIWEGDPADKFREMQQKLPPDLELAAARYEGVGNALSTWGTALSGVQAEADQALIDAKSAQDDIDAADAGIQQMDQFADDAAETARQHNDANPDLPPVQPEHWTGPDHHQLRTEAVGRLDAAREKLRLAVESRDEAQGIAASAISEAADDDLKNRGGLLGFWDDVKYSVVTWVEENSDWLNVLSDVLSIAGAIVGIAAIFFPVLAPLALALGIAALAVDLLLMTAGEKGWLDIGLDVLGIVTFGAGRAFGGAARAVTRAGRASAVMESAAARSTRLAGQLDDAVAARNLLPTLTHMSNDGSRVLSGAARNSRIARLAGEADREISRLQGLVRNADGVASRARATYDDIARNLPKNGWPGWGNVKNAVNPASIIRDARNAPSLSANLGNLRNAVTFGDGGYGFTGVVLDVVANPVSVFQGVSSGIDLAKRL